MAEWHCGKCEGADVLEHHRFCPQRDPALKVVRIIRVVWPPYGGQFRGRFRRWRGADDGTGSPN